MFAITREQIVVAIASDKEQQLLRRVGDTHTRTMCRSKYTHTHMTCVFACIHYIHALHTYTHAYIRTYYIHYMALPDIT